MEYHASFMLWFRNTNLVRLSSYRAPTIRSGVILNYERQ
jgi:hypothetical protein